MPDAAAYRYGRMDTVEFAKLVRKRLRAAGFKGSVRRDRGTAALWIEIGGTGEWGKFTAEEHAILERLGIGAGANVALIDPDKRDEVMARIEAAGA
jgi:hypothetical protein